MEQYLKSEENRLYETSFANAGCVIPPRQNAPPHTSGKTRETIIDSMGWTTHPHVIEMIV